jgi:hypothetical protein
LASSKVTSRYIAGFLVLGLFVAPHALAQEDKKTDEDKPADPDTLAPWVRRTTRLDFVVHHLGLALGGRPAAYDAREQ